MPRALAEAPNAESVLGGVICASVVGAYMTVDYVIYPEFGGRPGWAPRVPAISATSGCRLIAAPAASSVLAAWRG
jgi:hypothetical protein